jgi:hypothetical protein
MLIFGKDFEEACVSPLINDNQIPDVVKDN